MDVGSQLTNTPILYYSPRAKNKAEQRQYLLWPVFGYRVLAPEPRQMRGLNAFQRAVLNFCLIKERDPKAIGDALHLQPALIQHIFDELQRKLGLLDSQKQVTPQGIEVLRDAFDTLSENIVAGYVFQDAWNGELFPRFVEKLNLAQVDHVVGEDRPYLVFGTKGNPQKKRPFVVLPGKDAVPRTPSAQEVLDACKNHSQAAQRFQDMLRDDFDIDEDDNTGAIFARVSDQKLDRIQFISERPELYYLTTYLYVPQTPVEWQTWYVCDPFGLGDSRRLHQRIDARCKVDHSLAERLKQFLDHSYPVDIRGKFDDYQTMLGLVREEVVKMLGPTVVDRPFFDRLVYMEQSLHELGEKKPDEIDDLLEDAVVKIGRALESCFRFLLARFPPIGAWQLLDSPNHDFRMEVLNDVVSRLGFATPVPESFGNVSIKFLRQASNNSGGTLGAQIVVALLSAHNYPDKHPLLSAATEMPDFLVKLDETIRLRNKGAHNSSGRLISEQVLAQREVVYGVIHVLKIGADHVEEKSK